MKTIPFANYGIEDTTMWPHNRGGNVQCRVRMIGFPHLLSSRVIPVCRTKQLHMSSGCDSTSGVPKKKTSEAAVSKVC
jgi:hypothetical protein